jgi:hypothetical protein
MLAQSFQVQRHAVLVLGVADPTERGHAALALHGVAAVTADPGRRQLVVRYDPQEVGVDRIRRAVRPELDFDPSAVRLLLTAWPTLAKALPVAASLL